MVSNDNNIEAIEQLIDEAKAFINTEKEYMRLSISEKLVRFLTCVTLVLISILMLTLAVAFLAVAVFNAVASWVGTVMSGCLVALFFLILLFCVVKLRKSLIERPFVRLVSSIFLN